MSSSKPPQGKRERLRGWGAKLSTRSRSGEPAQPSLAKPAANAQTTETNETTETTDLGQDRATSLPSRTTVASYHGTLNHESGGHRDLWAIALQRLPEKDREGLLVTDQTSQNNVIEQLSKELRQQKQSFEADAFQFTFRGRRIVPREIADRAITMLDKFKEIGDVAVNFDPVHAALPWAGVRFLLVIAISEKKQRGELLLGTEKVISMTGRYKILEMLYLREQNLTQAQLNLQADLVATYTLILKFLVKVKHIQAKGSAARYSQAWIHIDELSAFFEGAEQQESRIDRAANTCESLAAHKSRGRSLDTEKRVRDLQKLLEDFKNPLECIQSGVSYVYTHIEKSERLAILQWISPIAYETDHDTACKSRTNDSGRWLLQDDRFRAWWQSESASIMWLHGLPGAGKTKLVSSVIDFAKPNRDESSSIYPGVELMYRPADSAIAYFYCDRNREDHRDPRSILCSFVRQLSMKNDGSSLHSHSVATYEKNKASGFATSQLSYEQALAHLQVLGQTPSQTFLILDALDECEESMRTKLVKDMQILISACSHPLKIFVSSRPNPDIKAELSKELNRAIGATDNRGDICKYVERMITDPRRTPPFWQTKLGSDVRQRVFEMLTQNAEGNFQWVALQIKQLHALSSTRDIETRLGKLPKTLKALYDEMYSQIQEKEGCASYIAERAFKWVMCSYESMSPKTLVDAVCQDPFTDVMDDVDDIDIDFVLQACQNLITVDSSGNACKFSHLSVQEYLENHRFAHREAHELVATICLKRLNCLESGPTNQSQLSEYVAMHWNLHVQRSYRAAPGDPRVFSLLQRFLGPKDGTSPQYRSWLQSGQNLARKSQRPYPSKANDRLYLLECLNPSERVSLPLALFGLHHILPDLWRSIDVLDCNDSGVSLLVLAARGGHLSTVETLIQAGSDVNSFNSSAHAQTALYTAVEVGSIPITQTLLANGADVNFCAPGVGDPRSIRRSGLRQYYGNALQLAAVKGNQSIVDLLLEAGAQMSMEGGCFGNALQAASTMEGNEALVRVLLSAGADVNAQGGIYGNALQAASETPETEATVKILLGAGADVNAQGGEYGNALQAASMISRNEATVKILLGAGADVNAQGGEYGNALQAASMISRNEATVKILLGAGADVNAQGGEYGNALQAASRISRNEATVKILLGAGAEVNAQGGPYGGALQAASIEMGNEAIVKILLGAGAEVNAQGGPYGGALQAASTRTGNEATVKILLGAGAEVNAQGGPYGGALQAASTETGNEAIVKILLGAGAEVNAQGGPYGGALQAASTKTRNEAVVRVLLNAGAHVNVQGGLYGSALQAAVANGHKNLVNILLKEGADVHAQGGCYGDALDLAVLNKSKETVQLLLDAGADVERIGGCGKALSAAFVVGAFDIVQSFLAIGCDMSTLEVDIEQWIKLGPGMCEHFRAPEAARRIFRNASRAIQKMLESTHMCLEDDPNKSCHPLFVGPEDHGHQMQAYIERGCLHLEKIKRRMMEAGDWEEDDFDESSRSG